MKVFMLGMHFVHGWDALEHKINLLLAMHHLVVPDLSLTIDPAKHVPLGTVLDLFLV